MDVLGIDIAPDLLRQQASWFAPPRQPFLVPRESAITFPRITAEHLPPESRDTFEIYRLPDHLDCVVLSEAEFAALEGPERSALVRDQVTLGRANVPSVRSAPPTLRPHAAAQADGHRFVWWPSLLDGCGDLVLNEYLRLGRRASRHAQVPEHVWARAHALVPDARELAGAFPHASGPNCFGTVMAAAGVTDAAGVWMQQAPFESWVAASATTGGDDGLPGTVMVWRTPDGLAQHAAITIGGGYALHKPSQGWMSPQKILTVQEVIASARQPGRRLHRYTLAR
ncbi:hypothetical protein [Pseudarthrobacter sp. PS3-L1]|uniref:hypothetical protein n=1 Tax=Pseudarthrobacter sp. PS3-L1 TaxID=3046207 RepID=UPI0024B901F4|nr:hypothetical protein [Pseudarthrobacter sp. PS3-L1]MDJ0322077.1 hypothetical protein [Pseudarthrobacter sp. PS3-L1]